MTCIPLYIKYFLLWYDDFNVIDISLKVKYNRFKSRKTFILNQCKETLIIIFLSLYKRKRDKTFKNDVIRVCP